MTDLEQAARMALEALERCVATCFDRYAHEQVMSRPEHFVNQAITTIKEALAEQPTKQRHIAYVCPQCHWTLEEQPAQQEHKPWCASLSALMFKARRPCDCKRVPLPAGDYEAGWNSALEMAAFKLQHDFKRAFGEDTLASIAVYIKEMKK